MLDKNLAADVLTAALSTGGSFAEIFVENTVTNSITLINNVVERASSGVEFGIGIRIFDGLGAVYAYTNDASRDNLLRVAKEAAGAVKEKAAAKVNDFVVLNFDNISPMAKPYDSIPKKTVVDMLRLAGTSAFEVDSQITQTMCNYMDVVTDVLVANSEGIWGEDRRNRARAYVSAVASSANEKQTSGRGPGAQKGFELFESMDFAAMGKESAEEAVKMLHAGYAPGGKMDVVIDNGFGGVIFHEACGHSLEATGVAKKASEFWDKKGKQIANPIVTAIDDGTMPGEWGSQNMDDEGGKPRRNVLIDKGILNTFLVDKLNGLRMGEESTGSGRRQNYRFAPTSRMTNTFIAPGNDDRDDIISSTEYGLYAKRMGGGSVQPGTGDFNFAVLEAYMIRNGKIAEPVRGASLIGKGSEVLMNIDKVSSDMTMEQGMCGSISGAIPTNVGQPMIRVKNILVGGRS